MNWLLVLLTIAFVLLKAFGVVAWSWWIVFIPAFILAGLIVLWLAIWLFAVYYTSRM